MNNGEPHMNMKDEMGIMPAAKGKCRCFSIQISLLWNHKPISLGYVAGHLRFKFIREEAANASSDDEDAKSAYNGDADDDKSGDGGRSDEGVMKGRKANHSREVTPPYN